MTTMVTARVPEETKRQAMRVFSDNGITLSRAIYEYLEYVAKTKRTVSIAMAKARPIKFDELTEKQEAALRSIKKMQELRVDWGDIDPNRNWKEAVAEAVIEKYERCGDGYSV